MLNPPTHGRFLKWTQQGCLSSETAVPESHSSQLHHWPIYFISPVLTLPTESKEWKESSHRHRDNAHRPQRCLPDAIPGNPDLFYCLFQSRLLKHSRGFSRKCMLSWLLCNFIQNPYLFKFRDAKEMEIYVLSGVGLLREDNKDH